MASTADPRRIFHSTDHPGQHRNWAGTGQEGQSLLGNGEWAGHWSVHGE